MSGSEGLYLVATGDLMLNRPLLRTGENATPPKTTAAYDILRQADISLINLEVPLTDRGTPADKLVPMRSDPKLVEELVGIGSDVATFANNHAMDFGTEGLRHTLDVLDASGIARCGAGSDLDEAFRPAVVSRKGLRVAFIGMATTIPPGFAARAGVPGIAPIKVWTNFTVDTGTLEEQPGMSPFSQTEAVAEDVERACSIVKQAREQADAVVVGIHWGVPYGWLVAYQGTLSQYQQPLAHALIDAGAGVIVGNHAHCLHGIELYQGCPIFYSLGNFMFHTFAKGKPSHFKRNFPPYDVARTLRSHDNQLSAVARVHLTGSGPGAVEIVPIYMNDVGEPELADGATAGEIVEVLRYESRPLGSDLVAENGKLWVRPSER